jgi:hypothetical protein
VPDTANPTQGQDLAFGGGVKGAIGTVATLANSFLTGAIKGSQQFQQKQIAMAGKKIEAVQSSKNAASDKMYDLAQHPDIKPILRKQMADPKYQLTPEEMKTVQPFIEARNQSHALNDILGQMQTAYAQSQYGGKGKGKGKKGDGGGGDAVDLSALMNPNASIEDKTKAAIAFRAKAGDIADYRVTALLSQPEPVRSPDERQNSLYAQIDDLNHKLNRTEADNAKLKSMSDEYDANKKRLEATPKASTTGPKVMGIGVDSAGKEAPLIWDNESQAMVPAKLPEGYDLVKKPSTGSIRKPDHFDDFKAQVAREAGIDVKDLSASSLLALNRAFADSHKTGSFSNGVYHYQDTSTGQEVEVPITHSTPAPALNVPKVSASQGAIPKAPSVPSTSPATATKAINPYPNPEDQPPDVSMKFNQSWTKPDWKLTVLPPEEEAKFQIWAKQNPNSVRGELDNPKADYDVRAHWAAAQRGDPEASLKLNEWDGKMHGNDKFKTPYNGTFSNESMYATPDAPRWQGDKLVTKDGQLVTDETPKPKAPAVPLQAVASQVKHAKTHAPATQSASASNTATAPKPARAPAATSANTLPPGSPKGARVIGSTMSAAEKMDAREIIAAGKDARSLDAALATMDDYVGGIKSGTVPRDSRKDLDLMIGAVRAMNPGSRRLPQQELKMEIEAGSWDQVMGRKLSVWSKGTIPDDQRTSLYNILKDETTKFSSSVARDYETKLPQLSLPDHLKRYATKREGGSGMGVSLSDARKLPFNKGKSDAEITKDLESRGHTVLPDGH